MPTWERVQREVAEANREVAARGQTTPSGYDLVRRQKIHELSDYLRRPVVVYAVDCLTASPKRVLLPQALGPTALMLEPGDKDAFAEVLEDIEGEELAIVLQSPGGFAETVDAIVGLLRPRFHHVSFVVPVYAKSAATMLSLSGNQLALDDLSELGPIDPQFTFPLTGITSPAKAILDQFERAAEEIENDANRLPTWTPILQQYAPSLLQDAREALDLSQSMVGTWLEAYMFGGRADAAAKAQAVARYFADQDPNDRIVSHARPIGIEKAIALGLNVNDLRRNPGLRGRVRELHHAVNITFAETGAYKIAENSLDQALIRSVNIEVAVAGVPPGQPGQEPEPAGTTPGPQEA